MKVFVTGVCGQLGHDVVNELARRGYQSVGSDIQAVYSGVADESAVTIVPYVQLDITDKDAVSKVITEINPDVIVHCAAWTAVDAADDEENKTKVDAINHLGTQYIAEAAKVVDAKMVYISTDYVFDGQGERHGNRMISAINRLVCMVRASWMANWRSAVFWTSTSSSVLLGFSA